jgi:hypothetical protein
MICLSQIFSARRSSELRKAGKRFLPTISFVFMLVSFCMLSSGLGTDGDGKSGCRARWSDCSIDRFRISA